LKSSAVETREVVLGFAHLGSVAFWMSDKEGKCTYASPGLCKLLGRTEGEIKDDNWANWMQDADRNRVWNEWQDFIVHDKVFNCRYTFVNGVDNSLIPVLGRAYKIKSTGIILGALFKQ
jgi:PAS domain-containing protein